MTTTKAAVSAVCGITSFLIFVLILLFLLLHAAVCAIGITSIWVLLTITWLIDCYKSQFHCWISYTLKTLMATRHCISITGGFGPSGSMQPMIASVWGWRSGANMYLYRLTLLSVSLLNASCLMNGKLTKYPVTSMHTQHSITQLHYVLTTILVRALVE